MVGAIHGRLLTAWSAAGVFGPVLVNYLREYQIAHGVPKAQACDVTMYVLAGMVCNRLVRAVDDKYFMTEAELAAEKKLAHEREAGAANGAAGAATSGGRTGPVTVWLAWAVVAIPPAIGVWLTVQKALILFK